MVLRYTVISPEEPDCDDGTKACFGNFVTEMRGIEVLNHPMTPCGGIPGSATETQVAGQGDFVRKILLAKIFVDKDSSWAPVPDWAVLYLWCAVS